VKCCSALDRLLRGRVALAHAGKQLRDPRPRRRRPAFLIDRQEAGEDHHLAGGAQAMCCPVPSRISTVVRSSRAEAIWLASARLKIRS
jgi:hypothetical protein